MTVFEVESILSPTSLTADTYSLSDYPKLRAVSWYEFKLGSNCTSTELSTYNLKLVIEKPPS